MTPRTTATLFPGVFRLRHAAALLLLAFWLPATLHCDVESLGLTFGTACCTDEASPAASAKNTADCDTDGCGTIESGFRVPSGLTTAPAPLLCDAICFWTQPPIPGVALLSPPATGVVEALAAPPEIGRCRVFVMRAALLPGAPSLA